MLIAFLRTSIRIRYIAPVIPPLVILSAFGCYRLEHFFAQRGRLLLGRCLIVAVALGALGLNFHYVVGQFRTVEPLSYISGRVSRDAYIAQRRPEYPLVIHANQHLTNEHVILALFMGNRIYYSDKPMVSGETWFTQAILQAPSVKEIREGLSSRGYTHILANMDLVNQWHKTFDRPDQVKVAAFFNDYARVLARNRPYALFEVGPITR